MSLTCRKTTFFKLFHILLIASQYGNALFLFIYFHVSNSALTSTKYFSSPVLHRHSLNTFNQMTCRMIASYVTCKHCTIQLSFFPFWTWWVKCYFSQNHHMKYENLFILISNNCMVNPLIPKDIFKFSITWPSMVGQLMWNKTVGYWMNYVTFTYDHTHDLDLQSSRARFERTSISGMGGLNNWHWTELVWVIHSWPWQWPLCNHCEVGGCTK